MVHVSQDTDLGSFLSELEQAPCWPQVEEEKGSLPLSPPGTPPVCLCVPSDHSLHLIPLLQHRLWFGPRLCDNNHWICPPTYPPPPSCCSFSMSQRLSPPLRSTTSICMIITFTFAFMSACGWVCQGPSQLLLPDLSLTWTPNRRSVYVCGCGSNHLLLYFN